MSVLVDLRPSGSVGSVINVEGTSGAYRPPMRQLSNENCTQTGQAAIRDATDVGFSATPTDLGKVWEINAVKTSPVGSGSANRGRVEFWRNRNDTGISGSDTDEVTEGTVRVYGMAFYFPSATTPTLIGFAYVEQFKDWNGTIGGPLWRVDATNNDLRWAMDGDPISSPPSVALWDPITKNSDLRVKLEIKYSRSGPKNGYVIVWTMNATVGETAWTKVLDTSGSPHQTLRDNAGSTNDYCQFQSGLYWSGQNPQGTVFKFYKTSPVAATAHADINTIFGGSEGGGGGGAVTLPAVLPGYERIATTLTFPEGVSNLSGGRIRCSKLATGLLAGEEGTTGRIYLATRGHVSNTIAGRLAIWADDGTGGNPGTKFGTTPAYAVASGAAGEWKRVKETTDAAVVFEGANICAGPHTDLTASYATDTVAASGWFQDDTYADGTGNFSAPTSSDVQLAVVIDFIRGTGGGGGGGGDVTAPTLVESWVEADHFYQRFNEPLHADSALVPLTTLALTLDAAAAPNATAVQVAGDTVDWSLTFTTGEDSDLDWTYTKPGSAPWIMDLAGNALATIGSTQAENRNPTPDLGTTRHSGLTRQTSNRVAGVRSNVGGGGV